MVLWLVTFGVRTTVVGIKFSLCTLTQQWCFSTLHGVIANRQ